MKNIDIIKKEAYLEFLKRLSQTPDGECVDMVVTPSNYNDIKINKIFNVEK